MKVNIIDYGDKTYDLRIVGETEFERQFLATLEVNECKKATMLDGKEKQIIINVKRGKPK